MGRGDGSGMVGFATWLDGCGTSGSSYLVGIRVGCCEFFDDRRSVRVFNTLVCKPAPNSDKCLYRLGFCWRILCNLLLSG